METEAVMLAEGPYPMTERVRVSDERLGKTIARADRMENSQANIGSDMLDLCLDLRDSRAEVAELKAELERMRQEWENLRGTAMTEAAEVATLKEQLAAARQDGEAAYAEAMAEMVKLRGAWEQAEAMVAALREAGEKVMDGFGVQLFVRNADKDHEPGWAIKIAPYIVALARLQKGIDDTATLATEHDARVRAPLEDGLEWIRARAHVLSPQEIDDKVTEFIPRKNYALPPRPAESPE